MNEKYWNILISVILIDVSLLTEENQTEPTKWQDGK